MATNGTEVRVGAGVYTPSKRTEPGDPRTATFQLINGVEIYGGFAGTEDPATFDLAARGESAITRHHRD